MLGLRVFLMNCAVPMCSVGLMLIVAASSVVAQECEETRGNVDRINGANVVDLNDAVAVLAYLYLGVSAPDCMHAADINDNGLVEPSDYTYLVNYLFNDGPEPPAPFPEPGPDPTEGVTVPEEPDERFSFAIGSAIGVPSNTGIHVPITMSNSEPVTAFQMVLEYNRREGECPDLLIEEIRTEEGTVLSANSAEYIIAEFHNAEGIAYIAALKDFATPFWFQSGEDPAIPAGEDQLVGTIVLSIPSCAHRGETPIGFVDGVEIPNDNVTPEVPLPEAHNLVALGDTVVRPVLGASGMVEIRGGFVRGDANKDAAVNIGDPVFALDYIFRGGRFRPVSMRPTRTTTRESTSRTRSSC